jgi:TonB family protein
MKPLLCIVAVLLACSVNAQDSSMVCHFPEMPQFPGGQEAYHTYLQDSIRYPEDEKAKNIGGVVYVYFEVSATGKIENAKIQRGVQNGPGLNAEALRVIRAMPDWTPGKMYGKVQRLGMTQPIRFTPDTATAATPAPQTTAAASARTWPPYAYIAPSVGVETQQAPVCTTDTLHNDTIPAEFPGGSMEQWKFIGAHVKYPNSAKEKGHQGDVFVQYDVAADGSVTNVRILKGVSGAPELEEEAIRVVKLFPKHAPATCNGKPVQFTMVAVVRYKLQ